MLPVEGAAGRRPDDGSVPPAGGRGPAADDGPATGIRPADDGAATGMRPADDGPATGIRPADEAPVPAPDADDAAAGTGRPGPDAGALRITDVDGGPTRSGLDGIGARTSGLDDIAGRMPGVDGGGASPSARRRTRTGCLAPGGNGAWRAVRGAAPGGGVACELGGSLPTVSRPPLIANDVPGVATVTGPRIGDGARTGGGGSLDMPGGTVSAACPFRP